MTIDDAKKLIGKEVQYQAHVGILNRVAQLEGGMIIGATDTGMVINIVLYKIQNEKGEWISIE